MAERTLEIGEAARILGISTEAVRKRIKRGSLKAQKKEDGQWLVILDESRMAAGVRDNGGNGGQADAAGVATTMNLVRSSAAIEETLRDEVDVLRDEITFLRDEVGRLETIIVSLTQNIKMLEAPRQCSHGCRGGIVSRRSSSGSSCAARGEVGDFYFLAGFFAVRRVFLGLANSGGGSSSG